MIKIEDFKKVADEMMKDIKVDEDLKRKTFQRCIKKRHISLNPFLVPAACLVLIFGMIAVTNPWRKIPQNEGDDPSMNIMMTSDNSVKTLMSGQEDAIDSGIEAQPVSSLEEAKEVFGESFLAPSYIPEGFNLDTIYAFGADGSYASKIILTYSSGNKSFSIVEEKTEFRKEFANAKAVDINGETGYLNPRMSGAEGSVDPLRNELHWFKDGVHYLISGVISEEDVIKIAGSMKEFQ